jgi:hypothetical protein
MPVGGQGMNKNKKNAAYLENQHHTQPQDWLLPILMNGQVSVA